jgi:hypothetical protein
MRYFFNVYLDGNFIPDSEGTEFPTVEAAQEETIKCAKELRQKFPREGVAAVGSIVETIDECGRRVFALPIFRAQDCLAPADICLA